MKVCLSGRQDREFLKKADEIKLEYRDRKIIPDYIIDYPGANIIIELVPNKDEKIDWQLLQEYNYLCHEKFYVCVNSIDQAKEASKLGIKFYSGYPVESDFELQGWINVEASYVRLGMPLFFEMDRLKQQYGDKIKFRTVPNVAYVNGLYYQDGINGQWIRPEDMRLYDQYIDVFEFEFINKEQEQALYKRYIEDQEWPGSLKTIISNFRAEGNNPMIPPEVIKTRLNCGQKCVRGSNCRICYRAMNLANPEKIQSYAAEVLEVDEK